MAQAPRRRQSRRRAARTACINVIGVQAALHQRARLARSAQSDRLGRGVGVVARVDDPKARQVDAEPFGQRLQDRGRGADEDRLDQPLPGGRDGPEERDFGVRRGDRVAMAPSPTALDEAFEHAVSRPGDGRAPVHNRCVHGPESVPPRPTRRLKARS